MRVLINVHDSLTDFLRAGWTECDLFLPGSVKDVIESLGIPHPEVGRIIINGSPADFDTRVRDGDQIEVYPCAPKSLLERDGFPCRPDGVPRFILDVHLGTLARYLRLLGYDTLYSNHSPDAELATRAAEQNRILLTRDVGLLKRSVVQFGYFVRSRDPEQQLRELVRRYGLAEHADPFSRCIRCNGSLRVVPREEVSGLVPARVFESFREFKRCVDCGRVYWQGSHMRRMKQLVAYAVSPDTRMPQN